MNSKINKPSLLSFSRKLEVSDALLLSGNLDVINSDSSWAKIPIQTRMLRGPMINRVNTNQDYKKLEEELQKPNLQECDYAILLPADDTLKVMFTLRVAPELGQPTACNDSEFLKALKNAVDGYIGKNGLSILAHCYACNIANARFLWRNRLNAEEIHVVVKRRQNREVTSSWNFDARAFSMFNFETPEAHSQALNELSETIANGLCGKESVYLEVAAFAVIGCGQEVFPSQEMILETEKSKTLYSNDGTAAFHHQKIGNAIRTIDTWYSKDSVFGPISVEAYGTVTTTMNVLRHPKNNLDFYSLFDAWICEGIEPPLEQQHYVIAMLIRGGVFGGRE